jgi:hypothetical protein
MFFHTTTLHSSQHTILILRLISATFWLGGMDDVVEGDWRWVSHRDDTPFNFTDWMVGQPDNYRSNQDCMYLYQPYQWKWGDAYCTEKQGYICERR